MIVRSPAPENLGALVRVLRAHDTTGLWVCESWAHLRAFTRDGRRPVEVVPGAQVCAPDAYLCPMRGEPAAEPQPVQETHR